MHSAGRAAARRARGGTASLVRPGCSWDPSPSRPRRTSHTRLQVERRRGPVLEKLAPASPRVTPQDSPRPPPIQAPTLDCMKPLEEQSRIMRAVQANLFSSGGAIEVDATFATAGRSPLDTHSWVEVVPAWLSG